MDSHQAAEAIGRYYPDEQPGPELARALDGLIDALDHDGAALLIARAGRFDHIPSPRQARDIAQRLYNERVGLPGVARARQALHN